MVRAFLFDIGNVLVRFDFGKAMRAIAPHTSLADDAEALARVETVKLAYEDGQMSRADFLDRVFEFLQYRGTKEQFIAAWQSIFTVNEPMVSVVGQLHARYPLFLLSNTNCMHVEGLFRDFDVFRFFKGGTYSHIARASKPHAPIYEIACRDHGLQPKTTFFIDDLEANIATARKLGFQAHQYHPDRHGELLEALVKAGVTISA